MAKSPGVGKCVHCLADNVVRNWDHVLPVSWYPKSMPPDIEKWKIPSCIPCNNSLGRAEDDLVTLLAMCVDPAHPASAGLSERILDSMNPKKGKGQRDKKARAARRVRFLKNLEQAKQSIPHGGMNALYPGLPMPSPSEIKDGIPMLLPLDLLRQVCEKIVRGHVYIADGRVIEPPFEVQFYAVDDVGAAQLKAVLESHGQVFSRAAALTVKRATVIEMGFHGVFEIMVWEQFRMYASVTNVDAGSEV